MVHHDKPTSLAELRTTRPEQSRNDIGTKTEVFSRTQAAWIFCNNPTKVEKSQSQTRSSGKVLPHKQQKDFCSQNPALTRAKENLSDLKKMTMIYSSKLGKDGQLTLRNDSRRLDKKPLSCSVANTGISAKDCDQVHVGLSSKARAGESRTGTCGRTKALAAHQSLVVRSRKRLSQSSEFARPEDGANSLMRTCHNSPHPLFPSPKSPPNPSPPRPNLLLPSLIDPENPCGLPDPPTPS